MTTDLSSGVQLELLRISEKNKLDPVRFPLNTLSTKRDGPTLVPPKMDSYVRGSRKFNINFKIRSKIKDGLTLLSNL